MASLTSNDDDLASETSKVRIRYGNRLSHYSLPVIVYVSERSKAQVSQQTTWALFIYLFQRTRLVRSYLV